MKRVAVLGSTGSIGRQALDIVRAFPDKLQVVGLAAGSNVTLMLEQAREFHPAFFSLESEADSKQVQAQEPGVKYLSPRELAAHPDVDLVLVATSGKAGLAPTLAALGSGKQVALANKEALVMAGQIVAAAARSAGITILPVDSEHSALWQCLNGERRSLARLLLTASGGAFRERPVQELASVTPEEALRHPTWSMGRKVTVDSATLMNKGMEVLEARWLFDIPMERIQVVMHPESIVHSLVEFEDGSVKAQLSHPDMRFPIQYALSYPERWSNPALPRLNLAEVGNLRFGPVDITRYPCLRLALEAGLRGGTYPSVLCAADEAAVDLFLGGKIGFLDIPRLVERTMGRHRNVDPPSLYDILAADAWAREEVLSGVSG